MKTETGRLQNWAFEELVYRHQLMIYKMAHKYQFKDYDFADKVNVFTHCLYEAIVKYDKRHKTQLSTYYYQIVRHEVFLINQYQNSKKRGGLGITNKKDFEAMEGQLPSLNVSTEELVKKDLKQFTERSNPNENPYQQMMDGTVMKLVKSLIQEDEINRFLLEGYLFRQQAVKELAHEVGFKYPATNQRIRRGLSRLQEKLIQQGWSY